MKVAERVLWHKRMRRTVYRFLLVLIVALVYAGRYNMYRFHRPSCSSVNDMKEKNKKIATERQKMGRIRWELIQ